MFPVLLFCLIWAHLLIHNATHGNLPKAINRIAGELLGLCVIVRFASWDIIHMRHHKYSDDRVNDPHPNFPSFWKTVFHTIVNVEKQLFQQYYEIWGDTPENHTRERRRAWMSYGTNIVLLASWLWLLGPAFFFLVFVPCNLLAGLFVIHFNWSTHNGEAAKGLDDMRPDQPLGPVLPNRQQAVRRHLRAPDAPRSPDAVQPGEGAGRGRSWPESTQRPGTAAGCLREGPDQRDCKIAVTARPSTT